MLAHDTHVAPLDAHTCLLDPHMHSWIDMEHEGGPNTHVGPGMTPKCQHWGLRGLGDDIEAKSKSRKAILVLGALLLDIQILIILLIPSKG